MKNSCLLLIKRAVKKFLPLFVVVLGVFVGTHQSSASMLAYYPFDTDALDYSDNGQGMNFISTSINMLSTSTKMFGVGSWNNTADNQNRATRADGPGNIFDRNYTNFTFSVWAKPSSWTETVIDRYYSGKSGIGTGGWNLRKQKGSQQSILNVTDSTGHFEQIGAESPVGTLVSHNGASTAVFHHIAFTYHQTDATHAEITFYFDGKRDGDVRTGIPVIDMGGANDSFFQVGNQGNNRNASAGKSFRGNLDDAAYWNEALSNTNMALIYGLGTLAGVSIGDKYPGHGDTQINEVLNAYNSQGSATAGGYVWNFDAGTGAAAIGTTSGTVAGGDAFIVLDVGGSGMKVGAPVDVVALSTAIAGVNNIFVAVGDADPNITVTVPASMVATSAVSLTITSSIPTVATPTGSIDGSVTVNFTQAGGSNVTTIPVHAMGGGVADFTVVASAPTLLAKNAVKVRVPELVGHWVSGAADLVETSGYRTAGTHDGTAVGGTAAFAADVPLGFTGQSLDLTAGGVGVAIENSATMDSNYTNTFDDLLAYNHTIIFWAKGFPNVDWSPWVSKFGEDSGNASSTGVSSHDSNFGSVGYQVRRNGGSSHGTFTIRNSPGNDEQEGNVDVSNSGVWHHFAAVRNSVTTGTHRLYVDGVLDTGTAVSGDFGVMGLAPNAKLMLDGRNRGVVGVYENITPMKLYDVRIFNGAITPAQIQSLMAPTLGTLTPAVVPLNVGDPDTTTFTVYVPASLVATSAVSVTLSSDAPTVANPVVTTVNFTQGGGSNTTQVAIDGGVAGTANITATSSQTTVAGTVVVSVTQPGLIGHWYSGAADHVETSGFRPAGTHDGAVVGGTPANQSFTGDVPAGFPGASLALAGDVGVSVNNSSALDGGYQNTFDNVIQNNCTITFWTKGFPDNGWEPWISKQGEGNAWQVRKNGDSVHASFTLRGTAGADDPEGVIDVSNGGVWRHYAAVWNGTYGMRRLYINGTADSGNTINDDAGPMGMELNSHVVFGGRDDNGYGNFSPMKLYDIRIYENALSQYAVQQLMIPPPSLTIQSWTGNQVRISWPVSYTGYALQQVTALGAVWAGAGLTVTVEGSENVAYAPASADERYYRLIK